MQKRQKTAQVVEQRAAAPAEKQAKRGVVAVENRRLKNNKGATPKRGPAR
jgi:hypothetical protein